MGWLVQDGYASRQELVTGTLKGLLSFVVKGEGQGVGEHHAGLPVDVVCHSSPPNVLQVCDHCPCSLQGWGMVPTTMPKEAPTGESETQLVREGHSP